MATLFQNGRFFMTPEDITSNTPSFATDMLVQDNTIVHIGSTNDLEIRQAKAQGVPTEDMEGRIVLPGFVDGHMHLLMHGQSLKKVTVEDCKSLEEIRAKITDYARANPTLQRILARGWLQFTTNGIALATMIDDIDPRPIYIDALDLHSTWCNTSALKELNLDKSADPVGGTIHRDASGKPSGLLSEGAAQLTWHYLAKVTSLQDRIGQLRKAIASYCAQGYTSVVEMAMDENGWEALQMLYSQEELPLRVAAHWLIYPTTEEVEVKRQVDRAIELKKDCEAKGSSKYRISGIKVILDGVVDGCTAALSQPYSDGTPTAELLWEPAMLVTALQLSDDAGLQCAIHAIGDAAIKLAVDSLENLGSTGKRHRIEHLEMASPEDAERLGKLGITASIQPVHSDPTLSKAWPKLIGDRCCDVFPYMEFANHGAVLAFGSDSPTASHIPFHNLYVATTRDSSIDPGFIDTNAIDIAAIPFVMAIYAATFGAAYSCFAESYSGRLAKGYMADFIVLDMEWDSKSLLKAQVCQTWFEGQMVSKSQE